VGGTSPGIPNFTTSEAIETLKTENRERQRGRRGSIGTPRKLEKAHRCRFPSDDRPCVPGSSEHGDSHKETARHGASSFHSGSENKNGSEHQIVAEVERGIGVTRKYGPVGSCTITESEQTRWKIGDTALIEIPLRWGARGGPPYPPQTATTSQHWRVSCYLRYSSWTLLRHLIPTRGVMDTSCSERNPTTSCPKPKLHEPTGRARPARPVARRDPSSSSTPGPTTAHR